MKPFADSFHVMAWQARNCELCAKSRYEFEGDGTDCPIEVAIVEASFEAGEIDAELAGRMGWTEGASMWQCAELEAAGQE